MKGPERLPRDGGRVWVRERVGGGALREGSAHLQVDGLGNARVESGLPRGAMCVRGRGVGGGWGAGCEQRQGRPGTSPRLSA